MNTDHANIRDEQFWFTAATVAFNTVLIEHDVSKDHRALVIVGAGVVSLFGAYLVLTRWLHGARRAPPGPQDWSVATALERLCYTWREFIAVLRSLPFVLFELSGALFYLLLIAITFAGVVYRYRH
jgi:hypothetical protein